MQNWDTISFILSSKLRFQTLLELKKGEKTPSKLAEILNEARSHISKTLKELEEKSLIICLTPDRRKQKFFKISDLGIDIISSINKMTT